MADDITHQDTPGQQATQVDTIVQRRTNGDPVTTSLVISQRFRKTHANVLKAIENLECSQEFRRVNFNASSYVSRQGKTMPMVEITRDGFIFLVGGFTGKEAAEWKEKFIVAFKTMENYIAQQVAGMSTLEATFQRYMDVSTENLRNVIGSQVAMGQDISEMKGTVSEIKSKVGDIESGYDELRSVVVQLAPRKKFAQKTKDMFNLTVSSRYNGFCPCCQKTRVFGTNGALINGVAHYEHWDGKQRNNPADGWLVCKDCNAALEVNRHNKRTAFDRFQQLMHEIYGNFNQLDLFT